MPASRQTDEAQRRDSIDAAHHPQLVFVNRYFHPDHSATSQMLADLAFHLAARGWPVTVVTSRQRYDDAFARLPAREEIDGVRILRVPTTRFGRARLAGRALDYLTFYIAAFTTLLLVVRRQAVVVALTDPPLISCIAAAVCKIRTSTLINWTHDLFPEVAGALGVGGGLLVGASRRIRDWSLHRARVNVTLGRRMAARVINLGGTTTIIHNWADGAQVKPVDPQANPLRARWALGSSFVVGYSGNLGRGHEFETMIGAMRLLSHRSDIRFLIIGGGAQLEKVKLETAALPNVQFAPYQPRDQLSLSLSAADVHLISLQPSLEGLIVPSKFYGILAAGRPAIFIGAPDGELAVILEEHHIGLHVAPGDAAGLAEGIRRLAGNRSTTQEMGRSAREVFEREYDRPRAMSIWEALLEREQHADE